MNKITKKNRKECLLIREEEALLGSILPDGPNLVCSFLRFYIYYTHTSTESLASWQQDE
jgi:hypothetical protein